MKQITINGNAIDDIPTFYAEVNRALMHSESWQIGESLDALNDLLYGGFGAIDGEEQVELLWIDLERTREKLGYEVTKSYYKEKLKPGSPFNKALFTQKLAALEAGKGETYFDMIMATIAEHPKIRLVAG